MKVFVYGTLKRDYSNHHILNGAHYIGTAYTDAAYRMIAAGFPVMLSGGHEAVFGEVYDVNDATLARLDSLEAEGVMYRRTEMYVSVSGEDCPETYTERVSGYVGVPEYWQHSSWPQWVRTNEFSELEWVQ